MSDSYIELLKISGRDQQGLISGIADILSTFGGNILDIGQSVIHSNIVLGVLVEFSHVEFKDDLRQELNQFASSRHLSVSFANFDSDDYFRWSSEEGLQRFIVTLLTRELSAEHLSRVAEIVNQTGLNIDEIKRLSGREFLREDSGEPSRVCIEFSLRGSLRDPIEFRRSLLELGHSIGVDLALQEDNRYRRNRRVVVFDMDSTLIEIEVIDELAELAGVGNLVRDITHKAMSGELDFERSLRERVSLLKDLPISSLEKVARRLPVTEGADNLIRTLRMLGYKTAIISGGFSFFADKLRSKLKIDYVYANELQIRNDHLTGKLLGQIIDRERKALLLKDLAKKEGIDCEQIIAVGDGANDLDMLSAAGLGVAFRAKPAVIEKAEQSITQLGLDSILYLLGIADRHHS